MLTTWTTMRRRMVVHAVGRIVVLFFPVTATSLRQAAGPLTEKLAKGRFFY